MPVAINQLDVNHDLPAPVVPMHKPEQAITSVAINPEDAGRVATLGLKVAPVVHPFESHADQAAVIEPAPDAKIESQPDGSPKPMPVDVKYH